METNGKNLNQSFGHIVVIPYPKTIFLSVKPLNLDEGKMSRTICVTTRCEKSGGNDVRLNSLVSGSFANVYNPSDCVQLDIVINSISRDIFQNFIPDDDSLV